MITNVYFEKAILLSNWRNNKTNSFNFFNSEKFFGRWLFYLVKKLTLPKFFIYSEERNESIENLKFFFYKNGNGGWPNLWGSDSFPFAFSFMYPFLFNLSEYKLFLEKWNQKRLEKIERKFWMKSGTSKLALWVFLKEWK